MAKIIAERNEVKMGKDIFDVEWENVQKRAALQNTTFITSSGFLNFGFQIIIANCVVTGFFI